MISWCEDPRYSSPKNGKAVISYSASCCSKLVFFMKSERYKLWTFWSIKVLGELIFNGGTEGFKVEWKYCGFGWHESEWFMAEFLFLVKRMECWLCPMVSKQQVMEPGWYAKIHLNNGSRVPNGIFVSLSNVA